MKTSTDQTIRTAALWVILALMTLATACNELSVFPPPDEGERMPGQALEQDGASPEGIDPSDTKQDQGQGLLDGAQLPLEQDAPLMPPMEGITVELDASISPEELGSAFTECGTLDGELLAIVDAPNPLEMAQALQMRVKDAKIQVMLLLDGTDTSFLEDFEVEIGKQSGDEVQAFVPLARLCDLADNERVLALYLPKQAIIQK